MNLEVLAGALLLGVIEGLTEFLPVSSTGHLILVGYVIDFQGAPGKVFEVVIQLGAIGAVCWEYFGRFARAATGFLHEPDQFCFVRNLLLAFLPTVAIGALAYSFIKAYLFDPWVVVAALVLGGVAILIIERNLPEPRHDSVEQMPPRTALGIGLCQVVSMIPGVSRAGATIMGGLMLGLDRRTATEFSFFLAVPTMLAASALDLYKNWAQIDADQLPGDRDRLRRRLRLSFDRGALVDRLRLAPRLRPVRLVPHRPRHRDGDFLLLR